MLGVMANAQRMRRSLFIASRSSVPPVQILLENQMKALGLMAEEQLVMRIESVFEQNDQDSQRLGNRVLLFWDQIEKGLLRAGQKVEVNTQ